MTVRHSYNVIRTVTIEIGQRVLGLKNKYRAYVITPKYDHDIDISLTVPDFINLVVVHVV